MDYRPPLKVFDLTYPIVLGLNQKWQIEEISRKGDGSHGTGSRVQAKTRTQTQRFYLYLGGRNHLTKFQNLPIMGFWENAFLCFFWPKNTFWGPIRVPKVCFWGLVCIEKWSQNFDLGTQNAIFSTKKTQKWPRFSVFWGIENGSSGALIKIMRPLFYTK